MAEISTRAVMDGITGSLRRAFPDAQISQEDYTQGLENGAFLVTLVSAGQQPLIAQRFRRSPAFSVMYFSDNSGNKECVGVADALCILLGTVTTPGGDMLRGTGIDWRVDDGVLQFFVSYPYNARIDREREYMEQLTVNN
jgi:hypothetical protein